MKIRLTKPQIIMLVLGGGVTAYYIYSHFFATAEEERKAPLSPPPPEAEADVETFSTPSSNDRTLVLFFKHGCPPCDHLRSDAWPQVVKKCQKIGLDVAEVDAEANANMVPEFVKGLPTIMLDRGGHVDIFSEHRSVENIMKFATQ